MKSVILMWTLLCISEANQECGGRLVKTFGSFWPQPAREISSLYEWNEDWSACLYYKSYRGIENRPEYFKIIIKDHFIEDDPIQVKVRRNWRCAWETLNTFSNIYISRVIITIHLHKYEEIKILQPRNMPFNLDIQEAYDIKKANSREVYSLPGYCTALPDDITAVNCVHLEEGIQCLFQCSQDFVPTYIDGQLYPFFIGQCHREIVSTFPVNPDFVKNWNPSHPSCLLIYEVADNCSDPQSSSCQYSIPALNVLFNISQSNESFRAFPQQEENGSMGVYRIVYRMNADETWNVLLELPMNSFAPDTFSRPPEKICRKRGFCRASCKSLASHLQLKCSICQFGSQCRVRQGVSGK